MRWTNEHARPKSTGEARRELPPSRAGGGAAPVEAQRAGELQLRRFEKAQLERWENEGGAADAATEPSKPH